MAPEKADTASGFSLPEKLGAGRQPDGEAAPPLALGEPRRRPTTASRKRSAVTSLAILISIGHAALYGRWLIDDAGISLAYARNLLRGEGWVAAAGAERVEGFSNPLWTLLLVPFSESGGLWRSAAIKVLAGALLAASLVAWYGVVTRTSRTPNLTASIVVLGVALQPAVVIWSMSGLENPLTLLLTALLAGSLVRSCERDEDPGSAATAGALAAALALNRPDGVLVSLAALALSAGRALVLGRLAVARLALASMTLACAAPVGLYLLFRRAYFGSWLPNTYLAKAALSVRGLGSEARLRDLLEAVLGSLGAALMAAAFLGWLLSSNRLSFTARIAVPATLGTAATAAYLVLPRDWMGEYRFATAAIPLLLWGVTEGVGELFGVAFEAQRLRRGAAALLIALAVSLAGPTWVERALEFAADPPVPLESVELRWGTGWNELARHLGPPEEFSFLLTDIGGALLRSELEIHDLAGLCSRPIAWLLLQDPRRLADYVYGQLRPTFIHLHGNRVLRTRLERDPRLRRDYFPLGVRFRGDHWRTWPESKGYPPDLVWGDFVRRDALRARGVALEELWNEYRPLGVGVDWRATRSLAGPADVSHRQEPAAPGPKLQPSRSGGIDSRGVSRR